MFSQYGINYNSIDPMFRKGTILVRESKICQETSSKTGNVVERKRSVINEYYLDIIGDEFWASRPELMAILEKN